MKTTYSYLCGYYGMKNTGDDALLLATAWGSEKLLGEPNFIVSTPREIKLPGVPKIKPLLTSAQRIKGENRFRHYTGAMKSNRVIFGGGSVLHNSHDINQKRHMIKLSDKKNALALGVGLGPFVNTQAEKACAKFLNECKYVGVRDQESFNIAATIAPNANVHLTFDLAPLLLLHDYYRPITTERSGICISLCPKESLKGDPEPEETRIQKLAKAINGVCEISGEKITLLDFNGHKQYGDFEIHKKLRALLKHPEKVDHISYTDNPIGVLQLLSRFKLVIGMRLHASILAYLVETPVLSLNYHSKCEGWCEQIGMPTPLRFDATHFDPVNLASTIINCLNNTYPEPELDPQLAVKKSLSNWRIYNESNQTLHNRRYSTI